jgi:GNAT superfamily N-acetyltransferase
MPFSSRMDRYDVIKVHRGDFTGWRELPDGYSFVPEHELDRDAERALLQSEFPDWETPFHRRMPGYIPGDGVVAVAYGGELVGIMYFCVSDKPGFEGAVQGHFAVVRPDHRGRGLFSAMVSETVKRIEERGHLWTGEEVKTGVLLADRRGHRAMYERWGLQFVSEKPKGGPTGDGIPVQQSEVNLDEADPRRAGGLAKRLIRRAIARPSRRMH